MAAAIDLAGRDVVEAVQVSVNPKVIDCPDPSDWGLLLALLRTHIYSVSLKYVADTAD